MTQTGLMTSPIVGFGGSAFRSLLESRQDPAWVANRREQAFGTFAAKSMPAMNHEEWRRTDIRTLNLDVFVPAGLEGASAATVAPESFAPHLLRGQFAGLILQVDGRHASAEFADKLAKKGVIYCSMDEAVREHRE